MKVLLLYPTWFNTSLSCKQIAMIPSRGYKIGPVCVSVCVPVCLSVIQHSHGWTVWLTDLKWHFRPCNVTAWRHVTSWRDILTSFNDIREITLTRRACRWMVRQRSGVFIRYGFLQFTLDQLHHNLAALLQHSIMEWLNQMSKDMEYTHYMISEDPYSPLLQIWLAQHHEILWHLNMIRGK